jgi:ribosome-binding factor A
MEYKRAARIGKVVREEISEILSKRVKDPRIKLVTITDVSVTDDLRLARVYFSCMAGQQEKDKVYKGLKSASRFIRRELGKRLELRYIPDIIFEYDSSLEYGSRIDSILRRIEKG